MTDPQPLPGTPRSLYFDKAIELLEDGEWHDYNRVWAAVAAAVPPSYAYRWVRMRRKHDPVDEAEQQRMVRTGQRAIARMTLSRPERFERQDLADGTRQIRYIPIRPVTREEARARAKKAAATLGPEGTAARSRKAAQSTSQEMRVQRALKGWETRRGHQ